MKVAFGKTKRYSKQNFSANWELKNSTTIQTQCRDRQVRQNLILKGNSILWKIKNLPSDSMAT